jgi:HSP20 family protein
MTKITPYRDDLYREMSRTLSNMRDAMERRFGWDFLYPRALPEVSPLAVNVAEGEDEVTVTTTLPGVAEDDIDIRVGNNILTISAEVRDEFEDSEVNWHVKELRYGKLERSVPLPTEVDLEGSEAELQNGVLTISLPKAEPGALHKIAVKARELLSGEEEEA